MSSSPQSKPSLAHPSGMDRRSHSQRLQEEDSLKLGTLLHRVFESCLAPPSEQQQQQSALPQSLHPFQLSGRVREWEGLLRELEAYRENLATQADIVWDQQRHHQQKLTTHCHFTAYVLLQTNGMFGSLSPFC